MRAFAPPTGKCSARGVMRVRKGLLETDLWGQISLLLLFSSSLPFSAFWLVGGILERALWSQISVLLLFSSSLLRVLARGGCPEKIAALRAGELRILAGGAALKNIAALREREIVRALRMSL